MGWFGKKRERLRGTARIVSTSRPPNAATHGRLLMDLVVEVPGIPAYAHEYRKTVMAVSKWPTGAGVLPVMVDPDDHDDVDVLWDEVASNEDAARSAAEQLAAQLRGESGGPTGSSPLVGGDAAPVVDALRQMFPGATVTTGPMDASMPPSGPPVASPTVRVHASQSDGDPIERLEKLARLRDAGVIDQSQFEDLRAQILGRAGIA